MTRPDPATLLPYGTDGYKEPGAADLRALMLALDITAENVAVLVGVEPRAVGRWLARPTAKTRAQIPYAAWRLLLIDAGLVYPARSLSRGKGGRKKL